MLPIGKSGLNKYTTLAKSDVAGHVKAALQYKEMKKQIRDLVLASNTLNDKSFIEIDALAKKPAKEIISNYNRDNYLAVHAVQFIPAENVMAEEKSTLALK